MTTTWAEAKALASQASRRVPVEIRTALTDWLASEGDATYERDRLHYGADLWPGKCERATWYGVHAFARDEESLGSQLRFKGGRVFEAAVASSLEHAGLEVLKQVLVRPLRPSAWAWSPGRADLVVVEWRKLIEVKAPRAAFFYKARGDRRKLVREAYRWQVSAYFHELRARGLVDRASILFLDREGSNEPIEVELDDQLLVPLEAIVAEETRKARLLSFREAPPRVAGSTVYEVLKGGRAGRAKPERIVRARARLSWQCSYCPFRETCQPGPAERPVGVAADVKARVVAEAERRWAAGARRVEIVVGEADEGDALAALPPLAEVSPAPVTPPAMPMIVARSTVEPAATPPSVSLEVVTQAPRVVVRPRAPHVEPGASAAEDAFRLLSAEELSPDEQERELERYRDFKLWAEDRYDQTNYRDLWEGGEA